MSENPRPPRIATWLVAARLRGERRDLVLGDLEEEFADARASGTPRRRAARRYWRQALASVLHGNGRLRSAVDHSIAPGTVRAGVADMWTHDLRYALRIMRKTPVWTAAVVLTVALAVGANTAVFSVVNAVSLRPLPFTSPDRLVWIAERNDRLQIPTFAASVLNYLAWQDNTRAFDAMGALAGASFTLTGRGEPEQFSGGMLTPSVFPLLGLTPIAGRAFGDGDDKPAAPPVVLISESLWRNRFGGDPAALLGQTLMLNGAPATVVGIAPPSLGLLSGGDIWRPLTTDPGHEIRLNHVILAVGRLRAGTSMPQAQADMDRVSGRMSAEFPELKDWASRIVSFHDFIVGPQLDTTLAVLLVAVGLVLLIACANVANLLLARAGARRQEIALRTALGASRARVIRQLVCESLLLAGFGGAAGLASAHWVIRGLETIIPPNLLPVSDVSMDPRVLGFAVVVTVATGLLFGLAPAWQASRTSPNDVLKRSGRGSTARSARLGPGLAALQLGLATLLLVGAGLLTQTVVRLQHVTLGFDTQQLLTFRLGLPGSRYPDDRGRVFYRELLESLRSTPGVVDAAASTGVPLGGGNRTTTPIMTTGASALAPDAAVPTDWRIVTPGYFRTMRIPFLRGRDFVDADTPITMSNVIVSQAVARRFWGDTDPIGRTLHRQGDTRQYSVVGVVGDVHSTFISRESPSIYYANSIIGRLPVMDIAVRTAGDPASVLPVIRQRIRDRDALLPVSTVRTMDEWIGNGTAGSRFNAWLMTAFALVAVVIAAIGIYGILAYSVTQRTREIGIRLALGSSRGGILTGVVREGLLVIAMGIGAGLAGAVGLSRWLETMVFGVTVRDPWTYALVAGILGLVAMAATVVPARHAARVEPVIALRQE